MFVEIDKHRCNNPIQRPRKPIKCIFKYFLYFFFANLAVILDFFGAKRVNFSKSLNSYSSSFKKFVFYRLLEDKKKRISAQFLKFCFVLSLKDSQVWKISKNSKSTQNCRFLLTLALIFEKLKTKLQKGSVTPFALCSRCRLPSLKIFLSKLSRELRLSEWKKITILVKAAGTLTGIVVLNHIVHDFALV